MNMNNQKKKIIVNYDVDVKGILTEKSNEFNFLSDAMDFLRQVESISVTKPIIEEK